MADDDDIPVETRDHIEHGLFSIAGVPVGFPAGDHIVSFRHILNTGVNNPNWVNVPGLYDAMGIDQQTVDLSADDAFTRAFESIVARSVEEKNNDASLQALLAMPSWTAEERLQWERGISEIISRHHMETPGLSEYRAIIPFANRPLAEERVDALNELSEDILNGTTRLEHDCEAMSFVEGMALQLVESHFLDDRRETAEGDLKYAATYYYANVNVNWSRYDASFAAHAIVVSSATGNIIEATVSDHPFSPYRETASSFEDFLNGDMILAGNRSIYQLSQGNMVRGMLGFQGGMMNQALTLRRELEEGFPSNDEIYRSIIELYREEGPALLEEDMPDEVRQVVSLAIEVDRHQEASPSYSISDGVRDGQFMLPSIALLAESASRPQNRFNRALDGETFAQTARWLIARDWEPPAQAEQREIPSLADLGIVGSADDIQGEQTPSINLPQMIAEMNRDLE